MCNLLYIYFLKSTYFKYSHCLNFVETADNTRILLFQGGRGVSLSWNKDANFFLVGNLLILEKGTLCINQIKESTI